MAGSFCRVGDQSIERPRQWPRTMHMQRSVGHREARRSVAAAQPGAHGRARTARGVSRHGHDGSVRSVVLRRRFPFLLQ
eukprot:3647093-Pyramimonas_sp.AAC.1